MARLPPRFRKSSEVIASFSFEDIASGLGIVEFFGISSEGQSGLDYHLVTNSSLHSSQIVTGTTAEGSDLINFDTSTFNLQRTAEGTAFLSIGTGVSNSTVTIGAQIQKVDADSNATNITSVVSGSTFSDAGDTSTMELIPLPITKTIIGRGEFLRLALQYEHLNTNSAEFGHDPQNGNGTHIKPGTKHSTVMRLLMTFKTPA